MLCEADIFSRVSHFENHNPTTPLGTQTIILVVEARELLLEFVKFHYKMKSREDYCVTKDPKT